MQNDFNKIAWFYDFLKKIVYGNSTIKAEQFFLPKIKRGDSVLIIGGGTGEILESIAEEITIDFVDASPNMISRAQKRKTKASVSFICGTKQDIPKEKYDVVITNFFLDLFEDDELSQIVEDLKQHCSRHWIVTDFQNAKSSKTIGKVLEWCMYRFFKLTTSIGAKRVADFDTLLKTKGMNVIASKSNYRGFVKTSLWEMNQKY